MLLQNRIAASSSSRGEFLLINVGNSGAGWKLLIRDDDLERYLTATKGTGNQQRHYTLYTRIISVRISCIRI